MDNAGSRLGWTLDLAKKQATNPTCDPVAKRCF